MSTNERIQRLEVAVLHLSRAVVALVDAYQSKHPSATGTPLEHLYESSDQAVREAYKNVQRAVDAVESGEKV